MPYANAKDGGRGVQGGKSNPSLGGFDIGRICSLSLKKRERRKVGKDDGVYPGFAGWVQRV